LSLKTYDCVAFDIFPYIYDVLVHTQANVAGWTEGSYKIIIYNKC
jgi:hypothetical protein